jgi:hypothetical protein
VTAFDTAAPHTLPPTDPRRLIAVAGLAVLLSELVFLGGAFFHGFFIADRAASAWRTASCASNRSG